ncbi:energy transducer TonB [Comamonas thiooxydans]|uniref:energy transducer TonB n=1 Tax=Comamonas thiooxydans TaxID=363952 RepID=UPI00209C0E7D|nr:energy transducer TonB [Comamonas thiooxydans]MCO8249980.1 energy transducer TonB [Comamonas thiooxydans]
MADNVLMDISRTSHLAAACAASLTALLLGACSHLSDGSQPKQPPNAGISSTVFGQPEPTPAPPLDTQHKRPQSMEWPAWINADCTPPAQLDRQPQPRRHTTPFISAHWFPNGLETTVVFRLEVTAQGQLGRVAYQPADADPRIVKSIMRSLERWKFKPGMRQGQSVTSCFEQPYQLVFPRQEIDVPRTPAMNTEPQ